jgi:hypothetical protein
VLGCGTKEGDESDLAKDRHDPLRGPVRHIIRRVVRFSHSDIVNGAIGSAVFWFVALLCKQI